MGNKRFNEKKKEKKLKIIFEKLTVKEEAKVLGGGASGNVCEKPVESDCAINQ